MARLDWADKKATVALYNEGWVGAVDTGSKELDSWILEKWPQNFWVLLLTIYSSSWPQFTHFLMVSSCMLIDLVKKICSVLTQIVWRFTACKSNDKSACIVWCNHITMDYSLKGMFLTFCGIHASRLFVQREAQIIPNKVLHECVSLIFTSLCLLSLCVSAILFCDQEWATSPGPGCQYGADAEIWSQSPWGIPSNLPHSGRREIWEIL